MKEDTVASVLWLLATRPFQLLFVGWNWKAAVLSAATRAPVFLLTTIGGGWRRAWVAVMVESAFRISSAGIFAAAIQAFRNARPEWAAALIILLWIPLLSQVLDGLLHLAMHTPNLGAGLLVSLLVTALSSLFNWYAMRRGALLIGEHAHPFWSDLRAIPLLVLSFLLSPLHCVLHSGAE